MASDATVLAVRKEARLWGYEYFTKQSGTKLEMIKQQPPITIIGIERNTTEMAESGGYNFNDYRTITLTTAAAETDVFKVEYGHTVPNAEISDITDFATEEVYSELRLHYNDSSVTGSSYVADLCEKLAAGYLIMKYWEGYARGEDFWKYGRNLVDTVHKRIKEISDGEKQLVDSEGDRVDKDILPFQYEILDHATGLYPSGLYTFNADDLDDEVY